MVSKVTHDGDGDEVSISYFTYVTYTNEKGESVEGFACISKKPIYEVGDGVRIRYLPGDYKDVFLVHEGDSQVKKGDGNPQA